MQTAGILTFHDLPEMVCLENPVDGVGLVRAALLLDTSLVVPPVA